MRVLTIDEIKDVAGGRLMCIPGDGQVEGSWADRWLGSFFRSGM